MSVCQRQTTNAAKPASDHFTAAIPAPKRLDPHLNSTLRSSSQASGVPGQGYQPAFLVNTGQYFIRPGVIAVHASANFISAIETNLLLPKP